MGRRLRSTALGCLLLTLAASCTGGEANSTRSPAPAPTASRTDTAEPPNRLTSDDVGYSLRYPPDWQVTRQVVATEFALGAECRSVEIVDFEPPPDAGPGAIVLRSFVQVCAMPVAPGSALEDFMRMTYGEALTDLFLTTDVGGLPAYQARGGGEQGTIFVQTERHRMEIVSAVAADPDIRAQRLAQVRRILRSLSLT